MSTITLLPDQIEVVEAVKTELRKGYKSVLMQSATGSGKTVMASYMVKSAFEKGSSVHFVVPRVQLLEQTAKTFQKFDIDYGYIASGYVDNPYKQVKIVSKDTYLKRYDKTPAPRLAFIDEGHFGGDGLDKIIQHYRRSGTTVIGMSATPILLSGRGMDHQYDTMVEGKSIRWLIDNKRLSDYRPFRPDHIDLSRIRKTAGDYNSKDLSEYLKSNNVVVGNAVNQYRKAAYGMLNILYAPSVDFSQFMAHQFREAGIPAANVDGETPEYERNQIIKAYARRELLCLCNCDLLTFGFDLSAASGLDVTVESMTDLAPTKSLAKQMQKWGRVLRMKDRPAVISDHANNFEEHLYPCTDRAWSLSGIEKETRAGKSEVSIKTCPMCAFSQFGNTSHCKNCGFEYIIKPREIEQIDGDLKEVTDKIIIEKKQKRMEVGRARTVEDLRQIQRERGYASGWVYQMAKIKGIKI